MTEQKNYLATGERSASAAIEYGIGAQPTHTSAHIAYFWEKEEEFYDAVEFLAVGLRKGDHCVVFGHDAANQKVCRRLEQLGCDVDDLIKQQRLYVLGAKPSGDETLGAIGAVFREALAHGAHLIRLLGNIGWGKASWPADADLLAFEAKVTEAAKQFPCVVVCMYDVPSLPGHIVHHGGIETHPHLQIAPGPLCDNPHYVPTQRFLERIESIAAEIAERKRRDDALEKVERRFRSIFEHSIDAILLSDNHGGIETANPEACRLFGYSEEEICRLGRAGLVDPTDTRLQELLRQRESTGQFRGELRYRRKDGSKFTGDVSSVLYRDGVGAAKAAVIIRDVTQRRRTETALRTVTEETAAATGGAFYAALVRQIARAFDVRVAFATECTDSTNTEVRTLACWAGEDFAANVQYLLENTPCKNVIAGNVCLFPEGVHSLFPEDTMLAEMGAQGYLGTPLYSATGKVVGHLALVDSKPLNATTEDISILKIFAARAGAELERKQVSDTLAHIASGTAGTTGEDFFDSLARHLAEALQVRYCFAAECTDDTKLNVRMLSFWTGEKLGPKMEYNVIGHPCEHVMRGELCAYPEKLQELFPDEQGLVQLNAQSYVGVPIFNNRRDLLGHLVILDDKPRVLTEREKSILEIFATRAGAELERMRTRNALVLSEQRLQALLDINNATISQLNRDDLFRVIGVAVGQIVWFDRLALSLYDAEAKVLRIVTYAGPYERADYSPVGRSLALDDSPVGQAFLTQKPVVRPNLEAERSTSSEERAYHHGFRSLCALPLIVRGQCIGTITLGSLTPLQYAIEGSEFLMGMASQIAIAIDNMLAHEQTEALKARYEAEAIYLQEEIRTEHNFEEIIGQSAKLREVLRQIEQVAPTEATVLIRGETGTGKELLARAVHDRSKRKDRPLVKVNCGAIPSGLVESELFGHEKGAFTGATQRRIGRFELANGGTIFLDEVTELPLDTQVKLLRVLQEGEFERVGSSQTIKVDTRVIAASNRNLQDVVKNGSFRSDLFYRLNVFPLEVPALRERREDIPLLVNFFLSRFAKKLGKDLRGVAQRSMESLMSYDWPGNIRELQNVIERAAVVANGPIVNVDASLLRTQAAAPEPSIETLEEMERGHIIRALKETNWLIQGKGGAATLLGINPSTLRSRMEKLGIRKAG